MCSIYFFDQEEDILNEEKAANLTDSNLAINNGGNSNQAKEGLALLLGRNSEEIIKQYGEPSRVDPSAYGYEWWIYKSKDEEYMQVGVENNKVVSIYALGENLNISPFSIGQRVDQLFQSFNLDTTIDIAWEDNSYRFELSEEDLGSDRLLR